MQYTTRREWNARAPRSRTLTSWSARTHFALHYSAASATQSPRQIQDFHMDVRGWDDIGYNWLVHSRTGEIFEGRGWLVVGAHIAGHNTAHVGVCVIGTDVPGRQDVSDAARSSVRALWAEAERLKRGPLFPIGHRERAATACPGDELYGWLRAGMPAPVPPAGPPADFSILDLIGDHDMRPYLLVKYHADSAVFALFGSGAVRHVGPGEFTHLTQGADAVPFVRTQDSSEYSRLRKAAELLGG